MRIRSDLWQAVMDVGTTEAYYWDGASARRGDHGQAEAKLPTATPEDLRSWREEFVSSLLRPAVPPVPVEHYSVAGRGREFARAPAAARAPWMAHLKRHVQERLEAWFTEQGIEVPEDLVTVQASVQRRLETSGCGAPIGALSCMARTELEELRLPVRIMFRSQRH